MIIEVLYRRGGVRQRIRAHALPLTIGRGYDCDLILDDRYVDARHARVDRDGAGGLALEDLGSVNGLLDPDGHRVGRLMLHDGLEVRLGRTLLRFVDADSEVAPALRDTPVAAGRLAIGESRLRALGISLGAATLLAVQNFFQSTGNVSVASVVGESLVALLLLAGWAGAWSFVNRVTAHRFRFLEHLAIPCAGLIAYLLTSTGGEYLQFLFPRAINTDFITGTAAVVLAVAVLAAHLARVSGMERRRRWAWSIGVTAALTTAAILANEDGSGLSSGWIESPPLKPLSSRLIPAETPGSYLKRVEHLKKEVDDLSDEE